MSHGGPPLCTLQNASHSIITMLTLLKGKTTTETTPSPFPCARACVRACVRARVWVGVCVCVCEREREREREIERERAGESGKASLFKTLSEEHNRQHIIFK